MPSGIGLMVSELASRASGPGSGPDRGHCVVFLGKTIYFHGASLHPGVQVGTGKFNAGGVTASCYRNQDKLWPNGPLDL